jgi:hypothetical protein
VRARVHETGERSDQIEADPGVSAVPAHLVDPREGVHGEEIGAGRRPPGLGRRQHEREEVRADKAGRRCRSQDLPFVVQAMTPTQAWRVAGNSDCRSELRAPALEDVTPVGGRQVAL